MRRRSFALLSAAVLAMLVAARLALPFVVKDYVNGKLGALQSYQGSIDDVHLALWRGAYRIDGMRIVKRGGGKAAAQQPFFHSEHIDFSVEWRSLFKGAIVGEGTFGRPQLNLIQADSKQHSQLGKEENWQRQIETLFPFRFNTIAVQGGTLTFRAPGIAAQDALVARQVEGTLKNLTNVVKKDKETFADFMVTANILKTGVAKISGSVNPWAASPTFDVNLSVEKVQLPQVNPWLRQYLKADAASGNFELYLEIAAAHGRFKGYAKPLMQNVDMHGSEDESKPALKRLWEGAVDFAANIFENKDKEQVAARIPFSGTVENPKAGLLETFVSVLHNAFVGAFAQSLEGSISLREVEKGLKKYELEGSDQGSADKPKEQREDRKDISPKTQ